MNVMHGMAVEKWQVQVIGGAEIDIESAPLVFGTPTITVGDAGLGDVSVPLVYGPVGVRTVHNWATMEVSAPKSEEELQAEMTAHGFASAGPRQIRQIDIITDWEIDWGGELRINGMETRPDGALVQVTWILNPYEAEDSEH